jgi:membrane protease YdiL (CAAX protease family)
MFNVPYKSPHTERGCLVLFFLLTYVITWGLGAFAIFLPVEFQAIFGKLTDTSPMYFLAVAAPTISATILTFAQDGWKGLAALYARLVHWRFGIQWYALVLLGIPVVGWIASQIAGSTPLKHADNFPQFLWLLLYVMITGPLCEELGWRGFALPRLLKRFNPFTASVILGLLWGVWHLPAFFVSGMVQAGMPILIFVIYTPCLSILMTWVFRHTGGSVLITVLIHYMVNFIGTILGVTLPTLAVMLLAGSIPVLVFDQRFGWFQPARFDRPVVMTGELQ